MRNHNLENYNFSGDAGVKSPSFLVLLFSVLLFFVVLFFSTSAGSIGFHPVQTFKIIVNSLFGTGDISNIPENNITIIMNIRLPRQYLQPWWCGPFAGAVMQGLLKNPLADGSTHWE